MTHNYGHSPRSYLRYRITQLLRLVTRVTLFAIVAIILLISAYVLMMREGTMFVGLMNSSEMKGFGGFFGSYALVEYRYGLPTDIQIVDSYYSLTRSSYRHPLPEYFHQVMPQSQGTIGMVGANMLGRTAADAETIRALMDEIFDQQIDIVVWVSDRLFLDLVDGYLPTKREREFLNATFDLRGGTTGSHKQDSMDGMQSVLADPSTIWQLLTRLPAWLSRGDHRGQLHIDRPDDDRRDDLLARGDLHLAYDPDHLWLASYQLSSNKIDMFTTQKISLTGPDCQQTTRDLPKLSLCGSGQYQLDTSIALAIPDGYSSLIDHRSSVYDVTLTQRERKILSLEPRMRRRHVLYLPPDVQIHDVDGAVRPQVTIETDEFVIVVIDVTDETPTDSWMQSWTISFSLP